jgi:uncharacterized repeat protein (TIGR02543 family)
MILLLMMSMTMLTQMKSNHVEAMNVFENLAFFEQLSPDPLLENDKVIQVALGAYQSIAVTENGRVFAWGYNHQGQLGDGSITTRRVPTNISDGFNLSEGDKVIQVSAANAHSSALTENGKVFFWGDNAFGQLGDASATDQLLPVDITDVFNLSEGDKVIQISLGDYFSSALTSTGRVFTWGRNNQGQLGIGSDIDQLLPIDITDNLNLTEDDKVIQISLGSVHSSVLTQNGKVLTWGLNYYGQLGDNTTMFKLVPTDISDRFPAGDKVIQLSMGASHSSARTESGKIYTWGRNLSGELGDDSTTSKSVPTDITGGFPAEDKVIQLSLQGVHSSALTESGKVFVWGDNQYGQVGDDSTTNKLVPIDITSGFQAGDKVIQLSLGGYHSSALTESGEVYTWGFNVMSQLGDNTIVSKRVPMLLDTIGAPLSFTMSFNSNGGSAVNHIEEYEGTEISAPTTPTKSGYTFGGWYSDSALTTTFIFATMPSENIILYAKWNIEDYDISYTLNDGTNHQDNPVIYHIETPTITLASPTKNGYAFAGWYDNADFNGSAITSIPMGSAGDKILYAKWTINQYTITFNTSGGSEVAAITQDYGTPISAPVNPTRVGHTFNGWSQAVPMNMSAENLELTAQWTINQYTITFNTSGGSEVAAITQDYGTPISAPVNPTRVGHTFNGWSQAVPMNMSAENLELTAQWTINQYTITFNTSGGSEVAAITQDYGTPISAPVNPTRVGHTFNGWSQAVPMNMSAENLELTAQWTINQYTITFNTSGGSEVAAITQDYGTPISAPVNPTRVGHTFNGWSQAVPMNMSAENLELTAQWTINQYTITFNTSGGSEVAAITQDYGTPISAPVNPTRVGHTFNGWSQAIPVNMPADSIAIRAFWILYSQDTGDISTETEDLHNKYDASLTEGKDAEIIIKIRVQPEDSLLPTEGTVFSDTVKNDLQLRRSGSLFLNIEIILKEVGQEDVLVQELLDPLAITIVIPQKHQGYQDYHIIRMHNGVAEALDTQYDAQNQTLTFETDRFSTYMIAYDMASGSGWWWLLLLLVIPVAFLIYRYTKKASNQAINNEKQDALEPLEEVVRFEEVVIKNIEERPQYKAFEKVDNGDYLEITPDLEASNNVVEVSTGVLPKLMNDQNHFIPLEENEVPQFKLSDVSLVVYHKLTPGSYTESGYFMEVDLNNRSVEYYVYTKRRLPPTSAKGHRWVRIESRKIKTD